MAQKMLLMLSALWLALMQMRSFFDWLLLNKAKWSVLSKTFFLRSTTEAIYFKSWWVLSRQQIYSNTKKLIRNGRNSSLPRPRLLNWKDENPIWDAYLIVMCVSYTKKMFQSSFIVLWNLDKNNVYLTIILD